MEAITPIRNDTITRSTHFFRVLLLSAIANTMTETISTMVLVINNQPHGEILDIGFILLASFQDFKKRCIYIIAQKSKIVKNSDL